MRPIDCGKKYIGLQETKGQNRGPIIDEWCRFFNIEPGASWCTIYISKMICEAYSLNDKTSLRERLGFISPFYCDSAKDWRSQLKRIGNATESPIPGDVGIVLDHNGNACHGFFVTTNVTKNGAFGTLEGNSNSRGSSNGTSVVQRTRYLCKQIELYHLPKTCVIDASTK